MRALTATTLFVCLSLVSGCEYDNPATGLPASVECNSCHGNLENAAPPVDTAGNSATSSPGVGAHQAHLRDGYFHAAFACSTCHVVPERLEAEGHIDPLPAEVVFSGLAVNGGLAPGYDPATHTCTNVYCHGASLSGGTVTTPTWTVTDGSQARCGTCHGAPPPAPHPQRPDCQTCHPETVGADGKLLPGRHLDGSVQVVLSGCDSCHGSAGEAAPPLDLSGNNDTSFIGVGAHRQHLAPSDWHATVSCDECHQVPQEIDDPGHIDSDPPAELTWGSLAQADGGRPQWDRASATCSGVYCHGATLKGTGSNREPVWTEVGTGQAECGSCHTLPPEEGHPQIDTCEICHPCVAAPGQVIRADKAYLHINGQVNLESASNCP